MSFEKIGSWDTFTETIKNHQTCVVFCGTEWSEPSNQMELVFMELAPMHPSAYFLSVDVDLTEGFHEKYKITTVPHFLFIKGGKLVEEFSGADPATLMERLENFLSTSAQAKPIESLNDRIEKLLSSHEVMLFMKGSPTAPRCGFSAKVTNALNETKTSFDYFDILQDEKIRQGLKEYSCWPTYPQLYVKGELIGGSDIVLDLHSKGELSQTIKSKINA